LFKKSSFFLIRANVKRLSVPSRERQPAYSDSASGNPNHPYHLKNYTIVGPMRKDIFLSRTNGTAIAKNKLKVHLKVEFMIGQGNPKRSKQQAK